MACQGSQLSLPRALIASHFTLSPRPIFPFGDVLIMNHTGTRSQIPAWNSLAAATLRDLTTFRMQIPCWKCLPPETFPKQIRVARPPNVHQEGERPGLSMKCYIFLVFHPVCFNPKKSRRISTSALADPSFLPPSCPSAMDKPLHPRRFPQQKDMAL